MSTRPSTPSTSRTSNGRVEPERETVDDANLPGGGFVLGLEHHRAGPVAAGRRDDGTLRGDGEATVLGRAEQRREARGGVEAGRTPPVDGTGSGHQRRSPSITQECVVLERRHCPETTSRPGRFIVNDDANRRERARGCRRRRQRRQGGTGRRDERAGDRPGTRRDTATPDPGCDRVDRRRLVHHFPTNGRDRVHAAGGGPERGCAHRDEHRQVVDRHARGDARFPDDRPPVRRAERRGRRRHRRSALRRGPRAIAASS